MAPAAPQAQNGVLQISTTSLNKSASSAPKNTSSKAAAPRTKVVIRRLAPGLVENEFKEALGDEWKAGGGKVDWVAFKPGKVSKDPAKPSRPSRAYLRVTESSLLAALAEKVKQTSFNDAKNTTKDSSLVGPPIVEFAPYPRVPGGRRPRHDARQGLIDQDPEFKDFLESLTNPITKPSAAEGAENIPPKEEIKTTPLIEHLREKKAQKEKPSKSSGKHARNESKDAKGEHVGEKKILSKANKDGSAPSEKGKKGNRAEKATKEAVKVLTKEAAAQKAAGSGETAGSTSAPPPSEKKRPNASIAAKVLQRDLGIGPAAGRRRGSKRELQTDAASKTTEAKPVETPAPTDGDKKPSAAPQPTEKAAEGAQAPKKERHRHSRAERRAHQAAKAEKAAAEQKATPTESSSAATPTPTILKKPATSAQPAQASAPKNPPTAPKSQNRRSSAAQNQTATANAQAVASPQASKATPTTTATLAHSPRQAFLKHANASQGITEPLIEEAFSAFGKVEKVEIDKRKGFAYVDFADAEGLQKAIAASPVKIAQGAVQVLERRERVNGKLAPAATTTPTTTTTTTNNPPPQAQGGGSARGGQGSFRGRGRGRGGGPAGRGRAGQENAAQQQAGSGAAAAPAAPPPPDVA